MSSMLAKDPGARPAAVAVYAALLPHTTGPGPDGPQAAEVAGSSRDHDPTRPFRWPLLASVTSRRTRAEVRDKLTDAEAGLLQESARALLDSNPSEAISLLEDGIERAGDYPALQLRLRHLLGAALFYAGEYTRAAAVLDSAGGDYRGISGRTIQRF